MPRGCSILKCPSTRRLAPSRKRRRSCASRSRPDPRMAKALARKPNKRTGKPRRTAALPADFCAAARDALKRGEPDAISDKTLQQVLTAAVKIYAAKVERRGHDVAPFTKSDVTATESVVA